MLKIKYTLLGLFLGFVSLATITVFGSNVTLTLAKLGEFSQVFTQIKQAYVDEVDDKTLIDNAIDGMLSKLDPHSSFLRPKQYDNLKVSTKGEFGGLGIEVNMSPNGFVKVISPIDDTPAFRAGIQAGDLIVQLNGKPVKGKTLSEAITIMRGKVGEKIDLSISRQGENKLLEIEVIRDIIQITSVRQSPLQPDYGYIRISKFQAKTGEQLNKNIDKLLKNEPNLKGVVIDLRNNPGGLLSSAIDVSSAFMDGGKVVYTQGKVKGSNRDFHAKTGERFVGLPLVVLINEGSASASEIVAGALQDTKRATIVGRKSFGKGSVQTIIRIKNSKSALKLTTAKYYTPKGRTIQAEGINPDIVIPRMKIELLAKNKYRVKEKDLPRHLSNEQTKEKTTIETEKEEIKQKHLTDSELIKKDYELYMALNVLKGKSR